MGARINNKMTSVEIPMAEPETVVDVELSTENSEEATTKPVEIGKFETVYEVVASTEIRSEASKDSQLLGVASVGKYFMITDMVQNGSEKWGKYTNKNGYNRFVLIFDGENEHLVRIEHVSDSALALAKQFMTGNFSGRRVAKGVDVRNASNIASSMI